MRCFGLPYTYNQLSFPLCRPAEEYVVYWWCSYDAAFCSLVKWAASLLSVQCMVASVSCCYLNECSWAKNDAPSCTPYNSLLRVRQSLNRNSDWYLCFCRKRILGIPESSTTKIELGECALSKSGSAFHRFNVGLLFATPISNAVVRLYRSTISWNLFKENESPNEGLSFTRIHAL